MDPLCRLFFCTSQGNVSLKFFKWESRKNVGENGAELVEGGFFCSAYQCIATPVCVRIISCSCLTFFFLFFLLIALKRRTWLYANVCLNQLFYPIKLSWIKKNKKIIIKNKNYSDAKICCKSQFIMIIQIPICAASIQLFWLFKCQDVV